MDKSDDIFKDADIIRMSPVKDFFSSAYGNAMKNTAFFAAADLPAGTCACGPIIMPPELVPAEGIYPIVQAVPVEQKAAEVEEFQEYMSAGCTATVPAGARKMYLVMAAISTAIGALIAFAIMNFT